MSIYRANPISVLANLILIRAPAKAETGKHQTFVLASRRH